MIHAVIHLDGARATQHGVGRCQAMTAGRPCRNKARWLFIVGRMSAHHTIEVCRMHANVGERAGKLEVAT